MLKKLSLLLACAAVVALSSCSSKMGAMKSEYFTVTPGVLEVVGSEVPVTVDGKFPAKVFNKKSVLTVTETQDVLRSPSSSVPIPARMRDMYGDAIAVHMP